MNVDTEEVVSRVEIGAAELASSLGDLQGSGAEYDAAASTDASLDPDLLSISDSSESFDLLQNDGTALSILNAAALRLFSQFRTATDGVAHSSSESRTNSAVSADFSQITGLRNTTLARRKRNYGEDELGSGDEGPHKPSRKQAKLACEGARQLLACPYWKLNPTKHRSCFSKRLTRVRDVKQHLSRNHTPDFYCTRCSTIFEDEDSLGEHTTQATGLFCTPSTILEGITYRQRSLLSRKSNPKLSEDGQWFAIWEILFPNRQQPKSPYMDLNLSEDLCRFREYCHHRGDEIIVEEIQASELWRTEMSDDERRRHLRMAVAIGLELLFDEWNSSQSSDSGQSINRSPSRPIASTIAGLQENEAEFSIENGGFLHNQGRDSEPWLHDPPRHEQAGIASQGLYQHLETIYSTETSSSSSQHRGTGNLLPKPTPDQSLEVCALPGFPSQWDDVLAGGPVVSQGLTIDTNQDLGLDIETNFLGIDILELPF